MENWINQVEQSLELTVNYDSKSILDVARVAAHTVERKAAPVTTFLMGIAFAHGKTLEEIVKSIEAIAQDWPKAD